MRLALELSLSAYVALGAISVLAPEDLALSGSHEIAEDEELGHVVGSLSATGEDISWSMVDDADGLFDISGSDLIVTGVLDFETATIHDIIVRATNLGGSEDLPVTITVTDVVETPPDNPPPDDGTIEDDDSFTIVPVVTVVDGGIKIHGNKGSLSAGKFIYDLGPASSGEIYTIAYDPDFTLMTNQGRDAAVGFVFKQGNDFHFVGNRGDGTTGLDATQTMGDGQWNSGTGWTEDNAGAVANGTQAGPNFVQIQIADDASTYTYRTGPDADGPWTDEYTAEVPVPHDDTATAQFGIGAIFRSTDTGSFSIKVTHFVVSLSYTPRQVVVGSAPVAMFIQLNAVRQVAAAPGIIVNE